MSDDKIVLDNTLAKNKPQSENHVSETQQIKVQGLYIKQSMFEAVVPPPALPQEMQSPVVDLKAGVNFSERDKTLYEAVLTLSLIGKQESNILWKIQLSHAGLFMLTGFTEEQRRLMLNGFCMNMLYPYTCETVNSMIVRGGFLPVYLAPRNFETLYRKQQASEKTTTAEVAEFH